MRFVSIFSLCVLALFWNACEQQPLPGDPPPSIHPEEKQEAKAEERSEPAHPAEGAKPEEAPKFFPEKK